MSHPLVQNSQPLVLELRDLLRELDGTPWREDLVPKVRGRIGRLRARFHRVLESTRGHDATELRRRLHELYELLRAKVPQPGLPRQQLQRAWRAYMAQLQEAYERVSAGFDAWSIRIPRLRPTNYARTVLHICTALFSILTVELLLAPRGLRIASGIACAVVWSLETGRHFSSRLDAGIISVVGRMAHPHERSGMRVNSATWYTTALFTLSLTVSPMVASVAIAVLGLGDPAAALIGRRWGRTKLVGERSLEGSLTFLLAGTLASLLVLTAWHPELGLGARLAVAAGAAAAGALAELFTGPVDDNLSIPLVAAGGAWLVLLAF